MKNELRATVILSVVVISALTTAGIISYMITKRRRNELDIETARGNEALQKYLETRVEIDEGSVNLSVDPKSSRKLLSTRSRHRKERSSLPADSRRIRFNRIQNSRQQSSSNDISDEVGSGVQDF